MVISKWHRGDEVAEVVEGFPGRFCAFIPATYRYAVTPDVGVDFASAEEAEAALEADGWRKE